MAQRINIAVEVDDNGSFKLVQADAKKARKELDKVGNSAATADRRLKGSSRQSSNQTKNFSKMAQGIQGGLVPAYATLAATMFAVSAAFLFFRDAADLRILQEGQVAYANSTGLALRSLTKDIQLATEGQLQFREAAQAAAIGTAAGLSRSQISGLASVAKDASIALGRDLTDSFNRLVRGATKAEPELLDELGIILRLKPATEEYARQIGKSANSLNAFERSQAVVNEVLKQGKENFKDLNVPVNQFNKLAVAMDHSIMKLKSAIEPVAGFIAGVLTLNVEAAVAAFGLFSLSMIKSVVPSLEDVKKAQKEAAKESANFTKQIERDMKALDIKLDRNAKKRAQQRRQTQQELIETYAEHFVEDPKRGPTSGNAYLFGAAGAQTAAQEKLAKRSFEASLSAAVRQAGDDKTLQISAMNFKGWTKERVLEFQEMYTKANAHGVSWREKWSANLNRAGLEAKRFTNAVSVQWTKMTNAMSVAWVGLMRGLNFIGILGAIAATVTLVIGLGKQIVHSFRSEEQKRFIEQQKALLEQTQTLSEEFKNLADNAKDSMSFIGTTFSNISSEGLVETLDKLSKGFAGQNLGWFEKLIRIGTLGGGTATDTEQSMRNLVSTMESLAKIAPGASFPKQMLELLNAGKLKEAKAFAEANSRNIALLGGAARFIKNEAQAVKDLSSANKALSDSLAGNTKYRSQIDALISQREEITNFMTSLQLAGRQATSDFGDAVGRLTSVNSELSKYIKLNQQALALKLEEISLEEKILDLSADKSRQSQRQQANVQLEQQNNKIQQLMSDLAIEQENRSKVGADVSAQLAANAAIATLEHQIDLERTRLELYKLQKNEIFQIHNAGKVAFEEGLTSQIDNLIQGTESSFGDAFIGIVQNVAKAASRKIAESFANKIMDKLFGNPITDAHKAGGKEVARQIRAAFNEISRNISGGMGSTHNIYGSGEDTFQGTHSGAFKGLWGNIKSIFSNPMQALSGMATNFMGIGGGLGDLFSGLFSMFFANGGVAKGGFKAFANGSPVVSKPTLGMVGEGRYNEAVVPLPDGKSIPVIGGGGNTNNVSVQVNLDSSGGSSTEVTQDNQQLNAFGKVISAMVQDRLSKELRPGGLLSRA